MVDIATGLEQHVQQVETRFDFEGLATLAQLDAVAVQGILSRRHLHGGEALDMRVLIPQLLAHCFEGIEHRRRPAAIEVRVRRPPRQVMRQVRQTAFLVVEVVHHLRPQLCQWLQQGRLAP